MIDKTCQALTWCGKVDRLLKDLDEHHSLSLITVRPSVSDAPDRPHSYSRMGFTQRRNHDVHQSITQCG